ncbi:MAG TPA: flavodoxin family protein [Acidobacteriota bacterium]|nr:flavodoxin family protein [Acidobacteriota bacterium]
MRILGVSGSPRKNGNTEIVINEVMKEAESAGFESETFLLSEQRVEPCIACGRCFETGACAVQDDMQKLYNMLARADAIVLGSPVYFGSVSAQMKAVMDRMFSLLQRRSLKGKIAGVCVVTRRLGAIQARSLLYSFCITHGMIVAGGSIGFGREPGEVLTGTGGGIGMTAMDEARLMAAEVARLTKRLRE